MNLNNDEDTPSATIITKKKFLSPKQLMELKEQEMKETEHLILCERIDYLRNELERGYREYMEKRTSIWKMFIVCPQLGDEMIIRHLLEESSDKDEEYRYEVKNTLYGYEIKPVKKIKLV